MVRGLLLPAPSAWESGRGLLPRQTRELTIADATSSRNSLANWLLEKIPAESSRGALRDVFGPGHRSAMTSGTESSLSTKMTPNGSVHFQAFRPAKVGNTAGKGIGPRRGNQPLRSTAR